MSGDELDRDNQWAGRLFLRLGLGIALADGLLGIPLMLRLIAPNGLYGLRTAETFRSTEVWYDANARLGWGLLGGSLVALMLYFVLKTGMWSLSPMAGGMLLLGVEAAIFGIVALAVAPF